MCILKFYCRNCGRTTNHGEISKEHELPNINFSMIQCLSCETGAFAVQYPKDELEPSFNSRRVADVLGTDDEGGVRC